MADINNVFGEYDESKPIISLNLPSKEELIAELLGLIPAGRAVKNFYDNPEGPISETLDLAAEDLVPLYASLIKPAIKGEDIDWSNAGKEVGMAAVPIGRISSRSRSSNTHIKSPDANTPAGPYQKTNTGSIIQNAGEQIMNTNTVASPTGYAKNYLNGSKVAWQGDMYPPGRSLRKDDMYGPFQWEDAYTRKLNDVIDENELKWEYLINKTRWNGNGPRPKITPQEVADIAMEQGRPDIATRALNDHGELITRPAKYAEDDPRYAIARKYDTYRTMQKPVKGVPDNKIWKDIGNRQVEKELRETFASLPEDPKIREKFADYYGVPDLYNSWLENPEKWKSYAKSVRDLRLNRELTIRHADKKFGRNVEK